MDVVSDSKKYVFKFIAMNLE